MAKKIIDTMLDKTVSKSTSEWMKKLAKGVATVASSKKNSQKNFIKIDSPSFNWALGGGLLRGKTAMFYGPESAGKTLIAMLCVIKDQQEDKEGIWIWYNAEFSFDKDRFVELGGDADRLLLVNSNRYTDIYDHFSKGDVRSALEEGAPIKGAVVDSVRAIIYPKDSKFEENSDSVHIGGVSAIFLTSALKFWIETQVKFGLTTIFIQQVAQNLDMYSKEKWVTGGGKALDHACDYKILIEKDETKEGRIIDSQGNQLGHYIKCTVKKNRVSIPQRKARFKFLYNIGITDQELEIYELAKTIGIIKHPEGKGNSYWQIGDREPIFGEKKTLELFLSDKAIQEEVYSLCTQYKNDIFEKQEDDEEEDIVLNYYNQKDLDNIDIKGE